MRSSWISSIAYRPLPDGTAYLAVFLKTDDEMSADDWANPNTPPHHNGKPVALLYGPDIPYWLPGLLSAGTGKRSIGLAYNRLLKGKHSYQRIEGAERVAQLKAVLHQPIQLKEMIQ